MGGFHVAEVTLYSLVNFLPCILLVLYPFRRNLRFSPWVTGLGILLNAAIHVGVEIGKYYTEHNGLLSLLCSGVHAVFMILMIRGHYGKSMFTLLMMTNISNFIITTSKCLEGLLFPSLALEFHRWSNSLCMVAVDIVVLLPLYFYIRKIYCRAVEPDVSDKLWHRLWLIPLTFYAVWFRNFYFSAEGFLVLALRPRHLLYSLVINAGALFIYAMVAQLIIGRVENERLREREYLHSLQHAQYSMLQDRIEEARRAKHDTRQHLHIISAYLQDKKYDQLEEYIGRYRKKLPEENTLKFCENYAINALLQYFAGYTKIIGTGFRAAVQLDSDPGIPEEDLTVVMGNLLENAVEACVAEPGKPVLSVRGRQEDGVLFLKVVNTCTMPPKTDRAGRFLSGKRSGYGIGLSSVEHTVEQYNGRMKAHWEDGEFTVSVLLTVPDEKKTD